MEGLKRFDVVDYRNGSMVVIESDLLPPDPAVVVIPLLADYPAVRQLNPEIRHAGRKLVLATRLIAAVPRSRLRRTGSVAGQGGVITHAVDVLMGGV